MPGGFPTLPTSIGVCDQLEHLSLLQNFFKELPDSMRNLTRLTFLDVSLNKLPSFPAIVCT